MLHISCPMQHRFPLSASVQCAIHPGCLVSPGTCEHSFPNEVKLVKALLDVMLQTAADEQTFKSWQEGLPASIVKVMTEGSPESSKNNVLSTLGNFCKMASQGKSMNATAKHLEAMGLPSSNALFDALAVLTRDIIPQGWHIILESFNKQFLRSQDFFKKACAGTDMLQRPSKVPSQFWPDCANITVPRLEFQALKSMVPIAGKERRMIIYYRYQEALVFSL